MKSLAYLPASDGSGNASLMTVQSIRAPGATTISVNTVLGVSTKFTATMGTPHTFTDPITGETITVVSEATAVDFYGHVDSGQLEIDEIAAGYTDLGSEVGDVVIIRPITAWADNLANVLGESLEDDGTLRGGVYGGYKIYTTSDTWVKPAKLKFIVVSGVGGGGGGGASGTAVDQVGGGGGGGGYKLRKIMAADLGANETVTIGSGGLGGAAGANAGANGNTSSFGVLLNLGSGNGGNSGNVGNPGSGGNSSSGGDILIPGQSGAPGGSISSIAGAFLRTGIGGASYMGAGGISDSTSNNRPGASGIGFGSGGSGGARIGASNVAGGDGKPGFIIVHEYF